MDGTKVIVITCAKDEAGMLDRFLTTCSTFADHIIVSDESTGLDDSLQIYKKYPKTIVHHNNGPSVKFDIRRRFVFEEARKIVCDKRIIIAIDVDEVISANILESPEWQTVLDAEPGTLIHLQWVTLWKTPRYYRLGYEPLYNFYNRSIWIDDGKSEIPEVGINGMHMVYTPENARTHIYLTDIVCLHYQFCNWPRMEAKHRFYRAHEKANIQRLSDLGIWRMYGYMNSRRIEYAASPDAWFNGWEKMGVDMTSLTTSDFFFYDLDTLLLLQKHGPETFVNQDIWSCDWETIICRAKSLGILPDDFCLKRPKMPLLRKLFMVYLRETIDFPFLQKLERHLLKGMSY